jgi:deoxyadenosine/deoxycytidine kinase
MGNFQNKPQIKFVSIEGNIGSGKSTLLANLKESLKDDTRVVFLKEPVDEWETIRDLNGDTMLQKFYRDQTKYAFSFQMMAYISRLSVFKNAVIENPDSYIFITERCLDTDKYVFAKMLFDNKKIEDVDYQIYTKWFDTFAKEFPIEKIVYVRTDPKICHERVFKRSRNGESSIPLEYLENCHGYHESMISNYITVPRIQLNGNVDIYENDTIVKEWVGKITDFIFE